MSKRDYYDVLGVAKGAGDAEIKSAFRKMAMKYHPDRNPGDSAAEAAFKEVNEAYEILKDPQKRGAYDQYGHQAFENGGGGPAGFDMSSFTDVFDDLFGDFLGGGGRRGGRGNNRGADLRYNLTITLEEAFQGKKAQINVPTSVPCEKCEGSGSDGASEPGACRTCRGAGRVRAQQGFFTVERTCPTCHGAGRVITNPCKACAGAGRVQEEKSLSVTIPNGVEDGTRIRLSGEGEAGLRGGRQGDLYIFISISPHRIFQREGANIFCRVPIAMTVAALGGHIEVPTIEGKRLRVHIPEGTQTGKQIRLRGKGMTELQGQSRGDMFAEVVVETPVSLTKRQREILAEFDGAGGSERVHQPESSGFFSKVRELWDDLTD